MPTRSGTDYQQWLYRHHPFRQLSDFDMNRPEPEGDWSWVEAVADDREIIDLTDSDSDSEYDSDSTRPSTPPPGYPSRPGTPVRLEYADMNVGQAIAAGYPGPFMVQFVTGRRVVYLQSTPHKTPQGDWVALYDSCLRTVTMPPKGLGYYTHYK